MNSYLRTAVWFLVIMLFSAGTALSEKSITKISKKLFSRFSQSIVKINCPGIPSMNIPGKTGTGFFVSANGIILTAGHVVEIPIPGNQIAPCQNLQVVLPDGRPLAAQLAANLSVESVRNDYAVLKTGESETVPIPVGSWTEVKEGDDLTIIGYPLDEPSPFLLQATVAARFAMPSPVSGATVNAVFFQSPANVGLSGSPVISNKSGKVVGIVSSKLVGLSPGLESILQQVSLPQSGGIVIGGVNFIPTMKELLQMLNERLISGMGGAVAVDYAKPAIDTASSSAKNP